MTAPTTVFALWGRSRDFSTWTVAVNRPFTFAYLARWQRVRMAATSRRKQYPPRVDAEDYWTEPSPSPRCLHWVRRINDGWRPGRHINFGYHGVSEYLGVYIWEYQNVVWPLLRSLARDYARAVECPRCGATAAAPYLTSATACHTGGATRRGSNLSDCHEERVQAWKAKHA